MKFLALMCQPLGFSSLPSRERGLKSNDRRVFIAHPIVAPFAGAWIEIQIWKKEFGMMFVAPFAGAWIEISTSGVSSGASSVAPFAGAWIEIQILDGVTSSLEVAPFAGAWIEIFEKKPISLAK